MAKRKRETRWVIFASPEQHDGPSHYIAEDGKKVTQNRLLAASFYTHSEAVAFAKEKKITLGAVPYIGQVDYWL